jgi:hypothetical protein
MRSSDVLSSQINPQKESERERTERGRRKELEDLVERCCWAARSQY